MASPREFVEFWLENSVHADEQFAVRRVRADVQHLADNLIRAAEAEGFTRRQMEAELGGDIYTFIRTSIDRQNASEDKRLDKEK